MPASGLHVLKHPCNGIAVADLLRLLRCMQGSVLDGHKLMLQLSQKRDAQEGREGAPANLGTKIVIRNVAFEATRKDVLGLFSSFGDVKSCRLPRKFDGTHR